MAIRKRLFSTHITVLKIICIVHFSLLKIICDVFNQPCLTFFPWVAHLIEYNGTTPSVGPVQYSFARRSEGFIPPLTGILPNENNHGFFYTHLNIEANQTSLFENNVDFLILTISHSILPFFCPRFFCVVLHSNESITERFHLYLSFFFLFYFIFLILFYFCILFFIHHFC